MVICFLSLTFQPLQSNATATPITSSASIPITQSEANLLTVRLNEINVLDKSSLTRSEKKELHGEVKMIEKQLSEEGGGTGGVYISAGAIIIILLLLIILL